MIYVANLNAVAVAAAAVFSCVCQAKAGMGLNKILILLNDEVLAISERLINWHANQTLFNHV